MLYIIGIMTTLAGIFMFVRFFIVTRRPRVYDARVMDVFKDYWEHPKYPGRTSPRKFRLARVEYYYQSQKYEATIILKSRGKKTGDTIIVNVSTENPALSEEYRPGAELLIASMVTALGIGIAAGSHFLMNYYDAW